VQLFHGTSRDSAVSLLRGDSLDPETAAALHIDGESGFYLATHEGDAEFFAARRPEGPVVLTFELSILAMEALKGAGAVQRGVPGGRPPYFTGDELFVPTTAFEAFNELMSKGEIRVEP
jgi:hypothetical protein